MTEPAARAPWLELRWWMAGATFLALALNTQLGAIAAASFLGIWVLHAAARPACAAADAFSVRLPWLYPLLAVMSVAWSQTPAVSLRQGIQFLLTTIIGILLARYVPPGRLVTALLAAMSAMCAASLAFGGNVDVGVSGESASIGLFGSKNYQASVAALLIFAALATLFGPGQRMPLRLLACLGLLLGALTLLRSRSAGATVTAAGASMVLLGILLFAMIPPRWRATLLALLAILALLLGIALASMGTEARDALLGAFGKDSGLTGRTYLWYRAQDSIARDPLLGVGYQAFWVRENVEAEGLWRYGHIQSRGGFHFHNLYVETTVELGYLGLAVLLVTLAATFACVLAWGLRAPDAASAFFVAYAAYTVARSFGEVELTYPFEMGTVLFAAAWVYATAAARRARWAMPHRAPPQASAPPRPALAQGRG